MRSNPILPVERMSGRLQTVVDQLQLIHSRNGSIETFRTLEAGSKLSSSIQQERASTALPEIPMRKMRFFTQAVVQP
jgi:hypothetical protein